MNEVRGTTTKSGAIHEIQPELLPALRRQWLVVLLFIALGSVGGYLYAASQPVVYEAKSTLLLIAGGDEVDPGGGRGRTLDIDTWATVARSTELLVEVADRLDLGLEDVRRRSTAVPSPTGDVLLLTFEAGTRENAVAGSSAYSDLFLEARRSAVNSATVETAEQLRTLARDIEGQIDDFSDQIDAEEAKGDDASQSRLTVLIAAQQRATERLSDLGAQLTTLDVDEVTGRVLIDPSTNVSRTGLGRNVIIVSGFALGALLGMVVALLKDRYDDSFDSVADSGALGVREIARVPYVDHTRHGAVALDGYDRLATKLTFTHTRRPGLGHTVLILPVESVTVPADAAVSIAAALEETGPDSALSVAAWFEAWTDDSGTSYWNWAADSLATYCERADLVVVPASPLDQSSIGIGLAALVDTAVLVVSEDTPLQALQSALDDLAGTDVERGDVILLTPMRRRGVEPSSRDERRVIDLPIDSVKRPETA